MSSKSFQKEKKVPNIAAEQKKDTGVKLRRKESTNKAAQPERKSVMFRFLHRDKKKGPELPEHGFIPDARRFDTSPKSISLPQVALDPKNRWSSYEAFDFSKLSSNNKADDCVAKVENVNKEATGDGDSKMRSSNDPISTSTTSGFKATSPTDRTTIANDAATSPASKKNHNDEADASQQLRRDHTLAEKMKQIDARLAAAFQERRRVVERVLKMPTKAFFSHPGLQSLLLESFLSTETLSKLASQSMNANAGNFVTKEEAKLLRQTTMELQKTLLHISEMLCSGSTETLYQPASELSTGDDFYPLCDQKHRPSPALDVPPNPSSVDVSLTTDVRSTVGGHAEERPSGDSEYEMLSNIDEENEDLSSTLERNCSLERDRPTSDRPLDPRLPTAFPENEANFSNPFRKEKISPHVIQGSSSASSSSFLELIHSSIAEEDETLCDEVDHHDDNHGDSPVVVCDAVIPEMIRGDDHESFSSELSKHGDVFEERINSGVEDIIEKMGGLSLGRDVDFDEGLQVVSQLPFTEEEICTSSEGKPTTERAQLCDIKVVQFDDDESPCGVAVAENDDETCKFEDSVSREGDDLGRHTPGRLTASEDSDAQSSVKTEMDVTITCDLEDVDESIASTCHRDDENSDGAELGDVLGVNDCKADGDVKEEHATDNIRAVEVAGLTGQGTINLWDRELNPCQEILPNEIIEIRPVDEPKISTDATRNETDIHEATSMDGEERVDSLGSVAEDDASDVGTPVNSDGCDLLADGGQTESNCKVKVEGNGEIADPTNSSEITVQSSSNKNGNNKNKKKNKRKKKNQQQQQLQTNNLEKLSSDSKTLKEICCDGGGSDPISSITR